mmetsp:Transcript_39104/g.91661  ORF Transcript_39104/g.91661 Transcript_39104/m.91661 type:complete len:339 (-) Transcript_39104:467-1483(-)
MKLSRANRSNAARRGPGSCTSEPLEDGAQVEPAVEEVLHLGKVAMSVLAEAERMVGASQRGLEVAQRRVDGQEGRMLGAGRAAAGQVRVVQNARALYSGEAAQPIGDQRRRRRQGAFGERQQRRLCERPLRQAQVHRLTGLGGLHRRHERHLVGRATPGLATADLAAEVGVVDLHPPRELAGLLPNSHHLHELVLDEPGRRVRHAELALELQGRHIVLGLRHQLHGQEPGRQRQLGGLEDRPAQHAALVATATALEVQPAVPAELAVPAAIAARAGEALRPAPGSHGRLTSLRGAETLEELGHRQALLVLNAVLGHGHAPARDGPSSRRAVSWRETRP